MPNLPDCLSSPAAFREHYRLEAGGELVPLKRLMPEWQVEWAKACDPAWMRAVGRPAEGGHSLAYGELTRGEGKTSWLAHYCAYALGAALRPVNGIAVASDMDQAALLRDALARGVAANPWLGNLLTINRWTVTNRHTGSELRILSSDAPSAMGLHYKFGVFDEFVLCKSDEFWAAIAGAIPKVPNCCFSIISNAGFGQGTHWTWKVREACRTSPDWLFIRNDRPSSRISEEMLAMMRKLLPPGAYARSYENRWTTTAGDALSEEDLLAAVRPEMANNPMDGSERDWVFAGGLDLGLKRDHSAFAIVAKNCTTGMTRLARLWNWAPTKERQVDLADVEATVLAADRRFHMAAVACDPWQAAQMMQTFARQRVKVEETPFSGKNLTAMAASLVEGFQARTFQMAPCKALEADLRRLSIISKPEGYRLEAARTAEGHADNATALALALLAVRDAAPRKRLSLEVFTGSTPSMSDQVQSNLQRRPGSLWTGHYSVRGQ